MFQLPEPDVSEIIAKDLEKLKQFALHTFAGPQDKLITLIEEAIQEMNSIPTEPETSKLIIED